MPTHKNLRSPPSAVTQSPRTMIPFLPDRTPSTLSLKTVVFARGNSYMISRSFRFPPEAHFLGGPPPPLDGPPFSPADFLRSNPFRPSLLPPSAAPNFNRPFQTAKTAIRQKSTLPLRRKSLPSGFEYEISFCHPFLLRMAI